MHFGALKIQIPMQLYPGIACTAILEDLVPGGKHILPQIQLILKETRETAKEADDQ